MRKRKDFIVQQSNISSESNPDSKYMILEKSSKKRRKIASEKEPLTETAVVRRCGRKRKVNPEDGSEKIFVKQEDSVVDEGKSTPSKPSIEEKPKKRGRPKKVNVVESNTPNLENIRTSHVTEVFVPEQVVDNSAVADNRELVEQSSTKEENVLELLEKKVQEVTELFSKAKKYFSGLAKTIDEKTSKITNLENVIKTQKSLLEDYQKKLLCSEQPNANPKDPPKKVSLKKTRKKKSVPQIKNMTINKADGSKDFNFGVRKPVTNCEELLSNNAWEKYLIDKWVHEYIPSEGRDVFYKHVLQNSRVLQIVYSGLDILGDGVYVLYKARLYEQGEDFFVSPQEFNLLFGSFECENYLGELLTKDLITKEELEIFKDSRKMEDFKKSLPVMKESLISKKA